MKVIMNTNHPSVHQVNLDQKLDLSTYCPEKGLQLERPVKMNKPKNVSKDAGIIAFRENFPLIWKYREGICNTPELSNITDENLGAGSSFAGLAKIRLGALLIKYNDGQLQCGYCNHCDCPTLGYFSTRGLSGHGYHWAFCPNCGQDYPKLGQRLDDLFKNNIQLCPVVETSWTICDLVIALQNIECEPICSR